MPHVDDGQMHGYLDGECTAAERHLLERHIEDCDACRALLEEAAASKSLATQLLGELTPDVDSPEWQDMLERAGEEAPVGLSSPRAWRRDLAWAATMVLAFALGWQASRGYPPATPRVSGEARLAEPTVDEPLERMRQATKLETPLAAADELVDEAEDDGAVARSARPTERTAAPTPRSLVAPPADPAAERKRAAVRPAGAGGDPTASREIVAIDALAAEAWLGVAPLRLAGSNPVEVSVGPGGGLPDAARGRPVLRQRYVLAAGVEIYLAQQTSGSIDVDSADLDVSSTADRRQRFAPAAGEGGRAEPGVEGAVFSVHPDGERMLRWRDRRGYLVWLRGNTVEAELRRLAATLRR